MFVTFGKRFRILKCLTLLSDREKAYKRENFEVFMLAILNKCCLERASTGLGVKKCGFLILLCES